MWRYVVVAVTSLALGGAGGTWYSGSTAEEAHRIGLGAQLIREDTVLSLLEVGKGEEAKRIQAEYLKVTMTQTVDPTGDWPAAVRHVLDRRRALLSGP